METGGKSEARASALRLAVAGGLYSFNFLVFVLVQSSAPLFDALWLTGLN